MSINRVQIKNRDHLSTKVLKFFYLKEKYMNERLFFGCSEDDSDSPMAIPITLGIGIPLLLIAIVCVVVSYMCLCRKDQGKAIDLW